jgi:secreted PhoX family phosphatase
VIRERPNQPVRIEAFLQVVGQDSSEITGPAFSPDGQRLYFSSQRGTDGRGLIYEISGPFPRPTPGSAPIGGLQQAERRQV